MTTQQPDLFGGLHAVPDQPTGHRETNDVDLIHAVAANAIRCGYVLVGTSERVYARSTGDEVVRAWGADGPGDAGALAILRVTCAGTGQDACVGDTESLALAAIESMPGGAGGVDTPGFTAEAILLTIFVPVAFVAIVLVPVRLISGLVRPRYSSGSTSSPTVSTPSPSRCGPSPS